MPYIKKEARTMQVQTAPLTAGELNYAITMLCHGYLIDMGLCYETLNTVVGALECAKLEFTRRKVVPYEDKKIAENGDLP